MVEDHVLRRLRKEIELATLRHTGKLDQHLISGRLHREFVSGWSSFGYGRCVLGKHALTAGALPAVVQFQRNLSITGNTFLFTNQPVRFGPEVNGTRG